jgi:hypothetical protein
MTQTKSLGINSHRRAPPDCNASAGL